MQGKIFIILILFSIKGFSQNDKCPCSRDLVYLSDFLVEKSVSFKRTINNKSIINQKKDSILKLILQDNNSELECRKYLSLLLLSINDGHLSISPIKKNLQDSIKKVKFINSPRIKTRKYVSLNLDSILQLKNTNVFDYYWRDIKIVDFKTENGIMGIVYNSDNDFYKKGDVFYTINNISQKYYSVFYTNDNEPISYYDLTLESAYKNFDLCKENKDNCYFNLRRKLKFLLEEKDNAILYISIADFKNGTIEAQNEFEDFFLNQVFKLYKDNENIIFDLRNNPGGAIGGFEKFFKQLKRNNTKKNIYVLQNRHTGSAAEIFTLKLKEFNNVIILGENSAGMISFRDIRSEPLPSGKYFLNYPKYVVNKRYKNWLKYERKGITPDKFLNNNKDWVEQALDEINKK